MKRVFEVLGIVSFIVMITTMVLCPVGGMNENNITLYQWWYKPLFGGSFLLMMTSFVFLLVMSKNDNKLSN